MTRIVTTTYRYKRPAKKRKAVALAVSAIVTTARKRNGRFGNAPDLTPAEHKRRGDAAEALFRELVRLAAQDRP